VRLPLPTLPQQAQSARLIGDAIQSNPAFLTLRKIEAAREIAGTIAASQNRVFLSADSLLLNLGDLATDMGKVKNR
jgi:prohibitin 2